MAGAVRRARSAGSSGADEAVAAARAAASAADDIAEQARTDVPGGDANPA